MQWDGTPSAGFTVEGVRPYLPLRRQCHPHVAAQRDDGPSSVLRLCRDLIALHCAEPGEDRQLPGAVRLTGGVAFQVGGLQIIANFSDVPQFAISILTGLAGAVIGVTVLWLCLRRLDLGEVLGTTSQLACVVGVAAGCDIIRDDAGLVSAILMGLAVANMRGFDIPARRPFFATPAAVSGSTLVLIGPAPVPN